MFILYPLISRAYYFLFYFNFEPSSCYVGYHRTEIQDTLPITVLQDVTPCVIMKAVILPYHVRFLGLKDGPLPVAYHGARAHTK